MKIKKENMISYSCTFIISYLLSCTLILMKEIKFDISSIPTTFIKQFHFNGWYFLKALLLSIPIVIGLELLFWLLNHLHIKKEEKAFPKLNVFIISFICIFISGLIFLITYYPGSAMTDTFDILTSPMGVANKNPLLYNLLIAVPYRIFYKILNNMNLSFFLISFIQLIIISFILSCIINWFAKTFKSKIATIIIIIYYTILPIVANYNTAIIKDSVFNIILLLYVPILYNLIITKGEWIKDKKNSIFTIIMLTITTLIRSNGLYLVILLLALLFIIYKSYYKKWLLSLIVIILSNVAVSMMPNIDEALFQEKMAIPLQQIAYVISTDGKISDKDLDYLNQVFTIENFKTKYHPYFVDNIKWDNEFNRLYLNDTKIEFLKVWFKVLPYNFEGYVKSYLLTTYGNYAPSKFINDQSRFLGFSGFNLNNFTDFREMHNKNIWPLSIQKALESFYNKTTTYFNSGTCFWILMILVLYIIHKHKYPYLLLTSPLIAVWLILMIASPLSTAFRYMSSYVYLLPVLYLIILLQNKERDSK